MAVILSKIGIAIILFTIKFLGKEIVKKIIVKIIINSCKECKHEEKETENNRRMAWV